MGAKAAAEPARASTAVARESIVVGGSLVRGPELLYRQKPVLSWQPGFTPKPQCLMTKRWRFGVKREEVARPGA